MAKTLIPLEQTEALSERGRLHEIAAHRIGFGGFARMTKAEIAAKYQMTEWQLRSVLESTTFLEIYDEIVRKLSGDAVSTMAARAAADADQIYQRYFEIATTSRSHMASIAALNKLTEIMGGVAGMGSRDDTDRLKDFLATLAQNNRPAVAIQNNFYAQEGDAPPPPPVITDSSP